MKIIFMGTPDFAVPSLRILVENGFDVAGVVTAPDKPGGRTGLQISAVKKFALERGIRVLQPEKLKNEAFLAELAEIKADLQVVVAFRMLPEKVWAMPEKGTINLHGSLLPKFRGAAPINWAVIRGEVETGCTTFFLKHEIDTGDILFYSKTPIGPDETAGDVHDRMMGLGAELVLKTVKAIENGTAKGQPQNDGEASHAPKIFHETCRVDFSKTSREAHDFVRGLSPFPGAWTILEGKNFKISRSKNLPFENGQPEKTIGDFWTDGKSFFRFRCSDGWLDCLEIQLEGKRKMAVRDFLNGHKFNLTH